MYCGTCFMERMVPGLYRLMDLFISFQVSGSLIHGMSQSDLGFPVEFFLTTPILICSAQLLSHVPLCDVVACITPGFSSSHWDPMLIGIHSKVSLDLSTTPQIIAGPLLLLSLSPSTWERLPLTQRFSTIFPASPYLGIEPCLPVSCSYSHCLGIFSASI